MHYSEIKERSEKFALTRFDVGDEHVPGGCLVGHDDEVVPRTAGELETAELELVAVEGEYHSVERVRIWKDRRGSIYQNID